MSDYKPVMPKEHGMWAWVLVPLLTGAGSTVGNFTAALPFIGGVFFWFLALTPARVIYKNAKREIDNPANVVRWAYIYGIAGALCFLPMVLRDPIYVPVLASFAPLFYLGVRASYKGYQRSFGFEISGIILLSLLSLAGGHAASGVVDKGSMGGWILVLIFLIDRNLQARNLVREAGWGRSPDAEPPSIEALRLVIRINMFIGLMSIVAVSGTASWFAMKKYIFIPFLPGILATASMYVKPPSSVKQAGWIELFLSIAFALLFVAFKGSLRPFGL